VPADGLRQLVRCAQDFAADPSMAAVLQGTLEGDVQGFHAALAPKVPLLGGLPFSDADTRAPNAYYLNGGQYGVLGIVSYARDFVKAKKVSLIAAAGFAATETRDQRGQAGAPGGRHQRDGRDVPYDSTDLTGPSRRAGPRRPT
jgi:hypothetical protein